MLIYDFIEVNTSHRIAPLQMLYIATLTYILKVTHFWKYDNVQYLENGESERKMSSTAFIEIDIRYRLTINPVILTT